MNFKEKNAMYPHYSWTNKVRHRFTICRKLEVYKAVEIQQIPRVTNKGTAVKG